MDNMNVEEVLNHISTLRVRDDGEIYISDLMPLIKKLKKDHNLAIDLWATGNMAARKVAVRVAEAGKTGEKLLERWVKDLDEWSLTDAFTGHLVRYTSYAIPKSHEWVQREPEFECRAGFATMAQMAWSRMDFADEVFIEFLPWIEKYAADDRFYVKKAVNWLLRDIGKRNEVLQKQAQNLALELQRSTNKTVRWVGTHRAKEFMTV